MAFAFGPPEQWQRFAVYFLTADGGIWSLCPVVPFGERAGCMWWLRHQERWHCSCGSDRFVADAVCGQAPAPGRPLLLEVISGVHVAIPPACLQAVASLAAR